MNADEVITRLRAIWAEVLKVPSVADDAHFVEAGGDSIAAVLCVHAVADAFDVELPQEVLYLDDTTLATCADMISHMLTDAKEDVVA